MRYKKLFKNYKVLILLLFLVFAIVSIHPNPDAKGVTIRGVASNSSASLAGIESPKPTSRPMSREIITAINQRPINNIDDYNAYISTLDFNESVNIKTNRKLYTLTTKPLFNITELNETEERVFEEIVPVNRTINGTVQEINETINVTKIVPKTKTEILGVDDIGLTVYNSPTTNIKKGLDLQGGTRVLLQPEEEVSEDDMARLIFNLEERLNVYGLGDIVLRQANDISGNKYILIEIAGANEEEVVNLLAKQGKFEAKIGNNTVFKGGKKDDLGVSYVCHSADCSGIDPNHGCRMVDDNQWMCRFQFSISIKPEASRKQAEVTKDIPVITDESGEGYLEDKLMLYLDDVLVDELNIAGELKGREVSDISISGSGTGVTEQEAVFNSLQNMKRLQTILDTGSLSVKLNIVKTDTISPVLGEEFMKNAILIGIFALLSVAIVVFIRYRRLKISIPMIITMLSEIFIILGFASLVGWNLDLAAIAGIIIAVGTGVDDLIVITDETLGKMQEYVSNWKDRIKKAFFIIMAAYFTTFAGMVPLWFAGAGLLKGFAFTTIVGISIGVFIARPAYAAIIEILINE